MNFRMGVKVASLFLLVLLMFGVFFVVALMYADPTRLKEQIEVLAHKKGIELDLTGDVSWAIYPNIELIVHGASASYENSSSKVDAKIGYFNVALKPWATLRGDLQFVGAEIADAEISVEVVEDGSSNSELSDRLAEASSLFPQTIIESLKLADIRINLVADGSVDQTIFLHHLSAENFASDGIPFEVETELDVAAMLSGLDHVELEGFLSIDPLAEVYGADFGQLSLLGDGERSQVRMDGFSRAHLDLRRNSWTWEVNLTDRGTAGLSGSVSGTVSPLGGKGRMEANVTDLRTLGEKLGRRSVSKPSIKMFAIDTDLALENSQLSLDNLRLRIDGNSARGNALYSFGEEGSIRGGIHFKELNLDNYISGANSEAGVELPDNGASNRAALSPELLAQLSGIKDLAVQISAEQLFWENQTLQDLHLNTEITEGLTSIKLDAVQTTGGAVSAIVLADLASGLDVQEIFIAGTDIDLQALNQSSADSQDVKGVMQFNYVGSLQDLTRRELLNGLQGAGHISVRNLTLSSMNLEQALCESAELVGATAANVTDWSDASVLGDIETMYGVKDGIAEFEEFDFSYGNMAVTAGGRMNLAAAAYALGFSVKINGAKTSASGCNINKYAQGVELPLQCSGSIGTDSEMSCGVDANIAERLVMQQVGGQIIEEVLGRLVDDKSAESNVEGSSEEAEQGEPGEENARREEIKSILEGLLKDIDD